MTKGDFIYSLEKTTGKSKSDCSIIAEAVFSLIKSNVAIRGEFTYFGFGKLEAVKVPERQGRNPQNGHPIIIPARTKVNFKAAKQFNDLLN